jgi:hypothetical protein
MQAPNSGFLVFRVVASGPQRLAVWAPPLQAVLEQSLEMIPDQMCKMNRGLL